MAEWSWGKRQPSRRTGGFAGRSRPPGQGCGKTWKQVLGQLPADPLSPATRPGWAQGLPST